MSHRNMIGIAALSAAVLLGGCTAAPQNTDAQLLFAELLEPQPSQQEHVALAAIGESIQSGRSVPATFHLGAGDALGQAVFIGYVAYCRANGRPDMHYATESGEASY